MTEEPQGPATGDELRTTAKVVARLSAELTLMRDTVAASAVIEQAKGVLMVTYRLSADQAGEELARRARAGRRSPADEARLTLDRLSPALPDNAASRRGEEREVGDVFSSARYRNGGSLPAPPSPAGGGAEPPQRRLRRRTPSRHRRSRLPAQGFPDGPAGSVTVLTPVRGRGGEVEDYRIDAASPEAVDVAGRTGEELVGLRVLEAYPRVLGTELWDGCRSALETGTVWTGAPFEYEEIVAGTPRLSRFRARAVPSGGRLVVSWERLDPGEREQHRLTVMQRLGSLGWADWDLVTDTITWSEQVYTIFGRDPGEGPMTLEELPRHVPPEDLPALGASVQRLLGDGRPVDHVFRLLAPAGVRHVRIVAEAERDAEGNTVEVHGFFQDVTATKDIEHELLERQLAAAAHRSQLEAERDLAARLRRALLPLPQQSLRAADLLIDVVYQPAHQGLNVGGDWYSAIELPDGSPFFVVGDVAGHGMDSVGTMTQLRFTAKGMAVTGTPLTGILTRLNLLLLHSADLSTAATATVIMARYQPETRTLAWARAGHPPPLLVRAGRGRYLDLPEGALLGATHDARYTEATIALREGDQLFLYTDGLIENPGEDLGDSLTRLVRAVTSTPATDAGLDDLVTALALPGEQRDDVCVLRITSGRPGERP
ncbi:SpoIIE family protein phosphatase [Streptomyces sp. NPDC097704]|uniref:SpoIIE family protein phosphatase n=1 Tax=Streptomyces sp. NPDC097704 TaxID=3157101 RepID=UPI0033273358